MKKWIIRIVVALVAAFLLIGIVPFSKEIRYSGIGYEFSLASDGAVAELEILIDGTYSSSLLLKDRFWGTFYVRDVEGLTKDMRADWSFEPNRWHRAYFLDYAGQAHSTEIVQIFFERNFESLVLQFATKYERDGDILKVAADHDKSNFLVIGAANKEEALLEYTHMLQEKRPKPWWQFWG